MHTHPVNQPEHLGQAEDGGVCRRGLDLVLNVQGRGERGGQAPSCPRPESSLSAKLDTTCLPFPWEGGTLPPQGRGPMAAQFLTLEGHLKVTSWGGVPVKGPAAGPLPREPQEGLTPCHSGGAPICGASHWQRVGGLRPPPPLHTDVTRLSPPTPQGCCAQE